VAKSIPLGELGTLKKVMGMTTSEHDGEALAALRRANAIMKKHSVSWADFFERTVGASAQHPRDIWPRPQGGMRSDELRPSTESDLVTMIQNAFDELRGVDLGTFREFVDSLEKQFGESTYLSPDQRKPLFAAVMRQRNNRRRDE